MIDEETYRECREKEIREKAMKEGEARGEARGEALGEARGEIRGEARGRAIGKIEGTNDTLLRLRSLTKWLDEKDRQQDIQRALLDRSYLESLFQEFGI